MPAGSESSSGRTPNESWSQRNKHRWDKLADTALLMRNAAAESHCHADHRDKTRQMVCAGTRAPTTNPLIWLCERRTKRSSGVGADGLNPTENCNAKPTMTKSSTRKNGHATRTSEFQMQSSDQEPINTLRLGDLGVGGPRLWPRNQGIRAWWAGVLTNCGDGPFVSECEPMLDRADIRPVPDVGGYPTTTW